MNEIPVLKGHRIVLGRCGDHEATRILFDVSSILQIYGIGGTFTLIHKRVGDTDGYPVNGITLDGTILSWTVSSSDLVDGIGHAQLVYTRNGTVLHTEIWDTVCGASISGTGTVPSPFTPWVTQITNIRDAAVVASSHYPYVDSTTKHWMVWNVDGGSYSDTGIVAEGKDGSDANVTAQNVAAAGAVMVFAQSLSSEQKAQVRSNIGAQDTIADLATIRSGAALGATAIQEHQSLAAYRTSAAQDVIDGGKQDTIADLAAIRSGAALGATAIQTHQDISGKVDKVSGKGLSSEDYTTAEKEKLFGIEAGATANVGTVTSVAVRMNGETKGTVTTSGEINLGTVITSHQDISGKVDKVSGMGLSENDYTYREKRTLANIAELLKGHEYNAEQGATPAYVQAVPTGAQTFAEVETVGGKSLVWNQMVGADTTSVVVAFGHKYRLYRNGGSDDIRTSYESAISVVGGSDMVFDLTRMFGPGHEPATVAAFKAMFPDSYYPYDAGSMMYGKCDKIITKDDENTVIAEYPIPAAVQALEGYGLSAGAVSNEIDFIGKKFRKKVKSVDMGTLQFYHTTSYGGHVFYTVSITGHEITRGIEFACPKFTNSGYTGVAAMRNYTAQIYNNGSIYFRADDITTVEDFAAAMNGVPFIYKLAAEVEVDISAYLTRDTFIEVEPGGTVVFHQTDDKNYTIPNVDTFIVRAADTSVRYVPQTLTDAQKQQVWGNIVTVKTAIDAVLYAGALYFLGEQSSVSITLPATANAGQEIGVVVYSGATALTLTSASTFLGELPVPAVNQRVELNFMWDGANWDLVSKVVSV